MRNPNLSKLLTLKQWLTLSEAAKNISEICSEEVSEADILRFALNGHLRLSVNFVNGTEARPGSIVSFDSNKLISDINKGKYPAELQWAYSLTPGEIELASIKIDENKYLNLENRVVTIEDVWDLPMVGNERISVENKYHKLIGGPQVKTRYSDGVFVKGRNGVMAQLLVKLPHELSQINIGKRLKEIISQNETNEKSDNISENNIEYLKKYIERKELREFTPYYETHNLADSLPLDSILVVRIDALIDFVHFINEYQSDKNEEQVNTSYRSKNLSFVIAASDHFWKNADEKERDTQPTNDQISSWLIQKGLSKRLAEAAASLIRPEWAGIGRKAQ